MVLFVVYASIIVVALIVAVVVIMVIASLIGRRPETEAERAIRQIDAVYDQAMADTAQRVAEHRSARLDRVFNDWMR